MLQFVATRTKWTMLGLMLALTLGMAGAGWICRARLLAWYCVYELAGADDAHRALWTERTAELEMVALPVLLKTLTHADDRACRNAQGALVRMGEHWGPEDDRRVTLAGSLADRFPGLSPSGQQTALVVGASLLAPPQSGGVPAPLAVAVAHLAAEAAPVQDCAVHGRALDLAGRLLSRTEEFEVLEPCRELTRACLHDPDPGNRTGAIRLAAHAGINLIEPVVGLLSDPDSEVRRQALLVVGPLPEAISADDLLPWLHDPDPEIRRLCETALRGRGLRDEYLKLGRLLTDSRAQGRLQILDYLRHHPDLEPASWLRRLSHDPAAAVRAAAVRAAADQSQIDLTDRLEQMVQNDPSPTVRQVARFYLAYRNARTP